MNKEQNIRFWNGQLLEIKAPDQQSYFAQIIQHEPALLIERPVNKKNIPMTIENGMVVTVYFYNDTKELYSFKSRVYLLPNQKVLMNKPQRRRFFRVLVAVEMTLYVPSQTKKNDGEVLSIISHDISGGGISFLFPRKIFNEGVTVRGVLHLQPNQDDLEFQAKVVHIVKLPNQIYRFSLEFVSMKESIRSEILRFCMSKQIELRNRLRGVSLEE